jgi:two-component system, OmpR family, sensor histidine kinase VicK
MNKKSRPLINAVMFRVFTALVLLFTTILYIIILGLAYLQYTGDIDIIYTDAVTHLLIAVVIVLFVIGWFFSYTLYIGIIKPVYETLNIISETVSNLINKDKINKDQVIYLNEFVNNSLSQLNQSSLTHKINLSLSTEIYLKKLSELMKQNEDLISSKAELANLVNELEKQQKLLELEKAKTTAIIDSIPNGLLVTSKDGNIFLVNQELEKLLDINGNNLLGKFIYNVLPYIEYNPIPLDSAKNNNVSIKNIKSFNYVSPDKKKNITIENTSSYIRLNNDILGSVYILRDTTQEQATERAQREFVSLASHQLRTPITSIKWNAEIIQTSISIDEEVKVAANDIYKEGARMEKLVNALLNLSRIDLGKIKFNIQEINLNKYIDELVSTMQSDIDMKKITFKKNINFKEVIINDSSYIDIVIGNILYNAVKYTNTNGSITVNVNKCKDIDKISIEIIDTGIGIPVSQQSQIFSRLFRADNAKSCQPDGNGLGLYIVKKLVELMGGSVWFESQENKGTTFFIELPIVISS